jgi:hypothetical protein
MAIQVQGNSGVVAEVDGTTYRALRVTVRPVDYGALGSYRISMISGTMAAGLAAASDVFQARWTDSTNLALVWGILIDGMGGSATAFTAGFARFAAYISRTWTADGSGGSSATLTGNNNKLRTSMATTSMSAVRISSTAALTTGTKTNDAQPAGQATFTIGTVASTNYLGQTCLYGSASLEDGGNPAPIVLAQNEGVTMQATVPATGTWQFGVTMAWSEVASY